MSILNNVRFPGQYHDRSTDLYYNLFRTYQPTLGRYLTPDPIGLAGGLDLYGYAGGNPINYTDPMGLYSLSEFAQDFQSTMYVINPLSWVADQIGAAIAPYLPEGLRNGTWFGTGYGEDAVDYWASRYNETGSPLDWTTGAIASLWTEDTWFGTASTLACASGAPLSTQVRGHSVYVGFDALGDIRYVGLTRRVPFVRFKEHWRAYGTGRELLDYEVLDGATGLTKIEARIWEQRLINQYGLGRKGGQLLNRKNSIARRYWRKYGIEMP